MKKIILITLIVAIPNIIFSQWEIDKLINFLHQDDSELFFEIVEIKGSFTDHKNKNKDCLIWLIRPDSVFSFTPLEHNDYQPEFGEGKTVYLYIKKPNGIVGKVKFHTRKYGIEKNIDIEVIKKFINMSGKYDFAFKIPLEHKNMTESIYRFSIEFIK